MKVLVACEFSGVVREAFKNRGHDAWSCDLLPTDIKTRKHIQGDVLKVLNQGFDMMIAFPPCTYICTGGMANITRRPHLKWEENREKGISFFMSIALSEIKKIAIENPVGVMSSRFRKPDQIIKPNMFGHPFRKPTCLWLKNLPKLMPTHEQEPNLFYPIETGTKKLDFWSTKRNPNGRSLKSITFSGIAKAMAEQWG
jgi:hypothetical protein